jgi:hypothetical protein
MVEQGDESSLLKDSPTPIETQAKTRAGVHDLALPESAWHDQIAAMDPDKPRTSLMECARLLERQQCHNEMCVDELVIRWRGLERKWRSRVKTLWFRTIFGRVGSWRIPLKI